MDHKLGDLPTASRESYAWQADVLSVAMRIAIPTEDWGSRGAITYATDIAEALAYLHAEVTPGTSFDQDFIEARKASLVKLDGAQSV
jgi:hypothetical protein